MHKLSRIAKVKERAWRKNYALREALGTRTREAGHERARADRALQEMERYAKVVADKSESISRLQQEIARKDERAKELIAERDRITKMVTQFLSVQILTSNIETTKVLRQI
jgi:chromosome segregation ATPase